MPTVHSFHSTSQSLVETTCPPVAGELDGAERIAPFEFEALLLPPSLMVISLVGEDLRREFSDRSPAGGVNRR